MANELLQFGKSGASIVGTKRYVKPLKSREIPDRLLKYEKAEELASEIKFDENDRYFAIVSGQFIFGDFIEALIVGNNFYCKDIVISTLSMSQNNVDSLQNLIDGGYVQSMGLIISDYFYSHERGGLVPYIYKCLDRDNKFQLAASGTHCKICLIETECGKKIVIHGSANLRSSSNLEQICVENNADLYDFNFEWQSAILEKFSTIKKSIRHSTQWQVVQK